jgi:RimJ/RimL family protein N-acetyltransferase
MSKTVDKTDRLVLLKESNDEKYYVFHPSVFKLYPKSGDMREMNIKEIALHLVRLIHGYKIYILTDKNDVVKGSILFSNGGSYRYPFATKNDLIDGPSYTVPEFRGQGVAVRIGDAAMNEFEKNYGTVYGTIAETNIPSLKRVKKNGFEVVGKIKADRMRRFHLAEDGNLVLVAYKPQKSV